MKISIGFVFQWIHYIVVKKRFYMFLNSPSPCSRSVAPKETRVETVLSLQRNCTFIAHKDCGRLLTV